MLSAGTIVVKCSADSNCALLFEIVACSESIASIAVTESSTSCCGSSSPELSLSSSASTHCWSPGGKSMSPSPSLSIPSLHSGVFSITTSHL